MNNLQTLKTFLRDFFVENFISIVSHSDIDVEYPRRERYEEIFDKWVRFLEANPAAYALSELELQLKKSRPYYAGYIQSGAHDKPLWSTAFEKELERLSKLTKQEWNELFQIGRDTKQENE